MYTVDPMSSLILLAFLQCAEVIGTIPASPNAGHGAIRTSLGAGGRNGALTIKASDGWDLGPVRAGSGAYRYATSGECGGRFELQAFQCH